MKKKSNPNFARVWLLIPRAFLKRFDQAIQGMFPTRSEAIRRGMNLVLEEAENYKKEPGEAQP
jgi:metal-responsive CopG/Arc/MetJ family transcriptional regulator